MAARANLISRWLVRLAMTSVHRLLSIGWFITRPKTRGVRAVAVTPEGAVVLLTHTYAWGWYLPGGGIERAEDEETAILRELREEIGLERYDGIRRLGGYEHRPNHRQDHVDIFLVEGVRYNWRRSLEIEEVAAFNPESLPSATSPSTRAAIEHWLRQAGDGAD